MVLVLDLNFSDTDPQNIPLGQSMMLKKIAVDPLFLVLRTALTRQGSTAIYSPAAQVRVNGDIGTAGYIVY